MVLVLELVVGLPSLRLFDITIRRRRSNNSHTSSSWLSDLILFVLKRRLPYAPTIGAYHRRLPVPYETHVKQLRDRKNLSHGIIATYMLHTWKGLLLVVGVPASHTSRWRPNMCLHCTPSAARACTVPKSMLLTPVKLASTGDAVQNFKLKLTLRSEFRGSSRAASVHY